MSDRMNRRSMLRALGLLGAGAALPSLGMLGGLGRARAQTRQNLVIVRTLFDFRRNERTSFSGDLAPLAPWSSEMTLVQGLSANGDGSEYHNGKQIRFATSCTPTNRTNRTTGGGHFDGKSVDVVVGEHLQATSASRHPYLVLGAYPYSDSSLHATFETISFLNKNQYIRPQYDLDDVRTQIGMHAPFCGSAVETVDVDALENENRVLEAVMMDLQRSRVGRSDEVRAQTENLERQFDARRTENSRRIGGAPTCLSVRDSPLAHAYSRHSIVTADFDNRVRQMNYTAALSLRSNFSNVVTLNYNFSGHGQSRVPSFHEMTHPGGFSRPPSSAELENLDGLSAFQVQMFAHLLRELSDFGVLGNTLVVYSPHERPVHDHVDVPLVAYGASRRGIHTSRRRIQDVNKDLLEHFGVPNADDFGGETSEGGVLS